MSHTTSLCLFVITLFIPLLQSQPLSPKLQFLTPISHNTNGVTITTSTNEVTPTTNNKWNVTINSQTTYQFIISLDNTWGFHPKLKSSIKLTINSPSIATGPDTFDDIVFAFTTNNHQYISTWIPMDNNGQKNRIYPNCDRSSNPTQWHGIGNIAILPNTNRNCDVAGGSCTNWNTMQPKNAQYPNTYQYNTFPITFTLENNPIDNTLFLFFDTISFEDNFVQKCGFISMNTNEGLKMYIGGHDIGQQFIISSFLIESFFNISHPHTPEYNMSIFDIKNDINDNITIINDNSNTIDSKINNETEKPTNNIGIVIGIIAGLFVITIVCAVVHINGLNCKSKNRIEDNEEDNVDVSVKDNMESKSDDDNGIRECKRLHQEGDDSEITGSNIRWHNLNALVPMDEDEYIDGDHNQTIDVSDDGIVPPPPAYQYE